MVRDVARDVITFIKAEVLCKYQMDNLIIFQI